MGLEDIKGLLIGMIIFIVIVTGGVIIIGSFTTTDPMIDANNDVGTFNNTLNKASNATAAIDDMSADIAKVSEGNVGVLGWLNALVGVVFGGLKTLLTSIGFMKTAAIEGATMFFVPPAITILIVMIITILIIFAIWSAITKT